MTSYQEPPGGDYSRYVEALNKKAAGSGIPQTVAIDSAAEPAQPRPAKLPASFLLRPERTVQLARVAPSPGQESAASQPAISAALPSVTESLAHLHHPWQIVKAPVFAWLGFEILSIFFPRLAIGSFAVLIAAVAWAAHRFAQVAGGWSMDAWSRLGRQWIAELEQQQRIKRR